jgi:hypothetical protein
MVITTALLAAGAMLIQDIMGVLLVQAEARNRAGLAAAFDSVMWLAQISTVTISVTALQGHQLSAKATVIICVELANVAGCYAGVAIGRRYVKEEKTGTIETAACKCGCPVAARQQGAQ